MDEKLEKIRKILAKAEHPSCPPYEAEALNEMAALLIAKYGIDMALLAEKAPDLDIPGDMILFCSAPYAADKAHLLHCIAKPMRVKTVRRGQKVQNGYEVHLFGNRSDLARVELLFTSLIVQAHYGMLASDAEKPYYEDVKAWRRSWLRGFANAVHARLEKAEKKAVVEYEQETGKALVVADRYALAEYKAKECYPDLAQIRTSRSGSGGRSGKAAGERADLGGKRLGGNVKGIGR